MVNETVLKEIIKAISEVDGYGSIEVFVQDFEVTQITVRKIRKMKCNDEKSVNYRNKQHQTLDKAISI